MTGELPAVLNGFDLSDQSRFAAGVPYPVLARLRREAPVLFHPATTRTPGGEGFWVLTRHADIAAAAADPAYSAQGGGQRAGGGSHLDDLQMGVHAGVLFAMMDDPRHDLIRRLLRPSVTGPLAEGLAGPLRQLATEVIDARPAADGSCDAVRDLAEPFALRSISLLLGAPRQDWDMLADWGRVNLGFVNRLTGTSDPGSAEVFRAMQEYFTRLLDLKRAAPAADIASVLADGDIPHEPGERGLSGQERDANAVLLYITGLEQPRNTAASAILAFAEHPEQWKALRADNSLLPSAIEEVLRWSPPNPYNRRTATRDLLLHGELIRAGQKVTFWWPSANRDEAVFEEPDVFDIGRTRNPHLSFGSGTHFCLGDEVARLQLRVFLEALLQQAAEIQLTGPVRHAPNNKHTVLLDLPVRLVPAARIR